jgi:hypothetical protein
LRDLTIKHIRRGMNVNRKRWLGVLVIPVVLLLAACQDVLTPDSNAYDSSFSGTALTVSNSSSGVNERTVFIPSSEPSDVASSYSATWVSGSESDDEQNGVIFRGVDDSTDTSVWDGVVLERSFFENSAGFFIVIYFHDGSFTEGPSVQLPDDGSWPLSLTASISADDVLTFAINGGSPTSLQLDSSMVPASGQTGTYFAHIMTDVSAVVSDVQIDGQPETDPTQ